MHNIPDIKPITIRIKNNLTLAQNTTNKDVNVEY